MKSYTVIEQNDTGDHQTVIFRGTYSCKNNAMMQIVNLKKILLYNHIYFFIECLSKRDDNFVYYYDLLKSFLDKTKDVNDIIKNVKYQMIETEIDDSSDVNMYAVKISVQNIDLSIVQKALSQENNMSYYKEKKSDLKSIQIDKIVN